jgi:hypothetical protein
MVTIQDLENSLEKLRLKWKDYPKSIHDKRWPEFRVDKSKALYLKMEIEKMKNEPSIG